MASILRILWSMVMHNMPNCNYDCGMISFCKVLYWLFSFCRHIIKMMFIFDFFLIFYIFSDFYFKSFVKWIMSIKGSLSLKHWQFVALTFAARDISSYHHHHRHQLMVKFFILFRQQEVANVLKHLFLLSFFVE